MPAKMRQEEVKQQEPVARTKAIKKVTAVAAQSPKKVMALTPRKQAKIVSPKKAATEPRKRAASKKEEVKEAKCEFDSNVDPCLEEAKKNTKTC